ACTNAFVDFCALEMEANRAGCERQVEQSLAMVTSLNPLIGYDAAAAGAKEAFKSGKTVRELCLEERGAGTVKKKGSGAGGGEGGWGGGRGGGGERGFEPAEHDRAGEGMTANAGASGWPRNGGLTTSEISPYGPGVLAPRGRSMTTASVAGLEIRVLHEPTVY